MSLYFGNQKLFFARSKPAKITWLFPHPTASEMTFWNNLPQPAILRIFPISPTPNSTWYMGESCKCRYETRITCQIPQTLKYIWLGIGWDFQPTKTTRNLPSSWVFRRKNGCISNRIVSGFIWEKVFHGTMIMGERVPVPGPYGDNFLWTQNDWRITMNESSSTSNKNTLANWLRKMSAAKTHVSDVVMTTK